MCVAINSLPPLSLSRLAPPVRGACPPLLGRVCPKRGLFLFLLFGFLSAPPPPPPLMQVPRRRPPPTAEGRAAGKREKGGGVYIYTCVGLSSLPPPLFFVRRHHRRLTPRITCSSCRVGMWGGIRARAIGPQTTAQAIAEVVVGGRGAEKKYARGGIGASFSLLGKGI